MNLSAVYGLSMKLEMKQSLLFVVVAVVVDEPIRHCLYGGQMSQRYEEFHQTLIVLEPVCNVSRITKVTLWF